MKKLFLFIALAIAISAQAQRDGEKPYLTKAFAGASISNVEVGTSGGGITLQGVDPSESRVEVYIQGNNRDLSREEIEERLKDYYDVTISLDGGKLYVKAKMKDGFHWSNSHSLNISFKVYAPKSISSHLNTSGGGIDISHLAGGNQVFNTSGGGLEIADIQGNMDGNTSGGGIHVDHANGQNIHLTTSGGGIEANHCSGDISLETSGGGLDLNNLDGTIRAHTSGGGIQGGHISGDLKTSTSGGSIDLQDLSCTLDASSSGGGIDVGMTALGKSIRLGTSAGSIHLTLPAGKGMDLTLDADGIETHNIGSFNGSQSKDHMDGSVNGGGIPVRLDASSGHIYLSCK